MIRPNSAELIVCEGNFIVKYDSNYKEDSRNNFEINDFGKDENVFRFFYPILAQSTIHPNFLVKTMKSSQVKFLKNTSAKNFTTMIYHFGERRSSSISTKIGYDYYLLSFSRIPALEQFTECKPTLENIESFKNLFSRPGATNILPYYEDEHDVSSRFQIYCYKLKDQQLQRFEDLARKASLQKASEDFDFEADLMVSESCKPLCYEDWQITLLSGPFEQVASHTFEGLARGSEEYVKLLLLVDCERARKNRCIIELYWNFIKSSGLESFIVWCYRSLQTEDFQEVASEIFTQMEGRSNKLELKGCLKALYHLYTKDRRFDWLGLGDIFSKNKPRDQETAMLKKIFRAY